MTDTTHLPNSVDAPLVDPEFIANKHKAAFVQASAVLNAEASLPAKVEKDADLERLAKHVKDARIANTALEAARKGEKARFDNAGKEVQALFQPRINKLDATKAVAEAIITRHNNELAETRRREAAEAAQREREEASRRAEAAAKMEDMGLDDVGAAIMDTALDSERLADKMDRVSTGSASDLVRTQTGAGTVTSQANTVFDIVDNDKLRASMGALGAHLNAPHIEQALRAYVAFHKKQGRGPADMSVPGVAFRVENKARIR